MRLEDEDKQAIFEIVAARYFTTQSWKWVNLRKDINKILKAFDELNEQYASYSYVSRDWYVENMGSKYIHMCSTWEELKNFVMFLNTHGSAFNFLVNTGNRKSFCIVSDTRDLSEVQADAIKEVQKLGYNTFIFLATVPDEIEFQLLQVRGVN